MYCAKPATVPELHAKPAVIAACGSGDVQADGPAKTLSWNAAVAQPGLARSASIAGRAARTPEEVARMDLRMARFQDCLQDPSPQVFCLSDCLARQVPLSTTGPDRDSVVFGRRR